MYILSLKLMIEFNDMPRTRFPLNELTLEGPLSFKGIGDKETPQHFSPYFKNSIK